MAKWHFPPWLIAASLVLMTIALYWPATSHDFVNYDDDRYVTSNVHVQDGLTWETIKWACLNPVADNWHPFTVWSHTLDCQVFGLNPWGHHLTNMLLHACNAGLVFLLLRSLTGALWRSVLVAALFAVHPLRVESVAWVSERKDVLSGCFGLLALMAYARYVQAGSLKSKVQSPKSEAGGPWSVVGGQWSLWYLLSLFLFTLGLMSKPMLVTWPFVMLLLDYWPLGRMQNAECRMRNAKATDTHHAPRNTLHVPLPLLVEKFPFFVLAALASVVTFVVQQHGGAVAPVENLPLGARVGNALISYCRYLGKLFWPTDLAVFYPHPGKWPLGMVLVAGGLLLGVSALFWVPRRRVPYLLAGWLWFLGTLVPVIGLIQVGGHSMADRYTYIPLIGVLILASWGAYELTRRWRHQVLALSVAGGAATMLCLALTRQQLGYWRDSEALFRHALEVTENNDGAHIGLGLTFYQKGQMDEAIRQYQEALRLKPDNADAHNNLGVALVGEGQLDEAIRQHQEALRLNPDYALAHNDLGVALARKGQVDEAIRQFQEAIRLTPDDAQAHNNHGNALLMKGQNDEAIRQYQEALRLNPGYSEAHFNLGNVLGGKGQTDEAIRQYQEALRLKPDNADAHNNLGIALAGKGRMDEAINHFQEALRLKPDNAAARKNLDVALAAKARSSQPPGGSR